MIKKKGKIRNTEIRVKACWSKSMAKGKGLKSQVKGLRKRISSLFQDDHHQNQGRDAEEQSCPASLCKEKKIPLR